jgi:hypothetical protein
MRILFRVGIRNKLLVVLLLPVLGMLFFSLTIIAQKRTVSLELAELEVLSDLAVRSGDLIHELQKERGMSAGYLSSNGRTFGDELVAQRALTDQKYADLEAFLGGFDRNALGSGLAERVRQAESHLGRMDALRSSVSSLSVEPARAVASYTETNGGLLEGVGYVSLLSNDARLARLGAG